MNRKLDLTSGPGVQTSVNEVKIGVSSANLSVCVCVFVRAVHVQKRGYVKRTRKKTSVVVIRSLLFLFFSSFSCFCFCAVQRFLCFETCPCASEVCGLHKKLWNCACRVLLLHKSLSGIDGESPEEMRWALSQCLFYCTIIQVGLCECKVWPALISNELLAVQKPKTKCPPDEVWCEIGWG